MTHPWLRLNLGEIIDAGGSQRLQDVDEVVVVEPDTGKGQ
jgi:hypothetical protein